MNSTAQKPTRCLPLHVCVCSLIRVMIYDLVIKQYYCDVKCE